VRAIVTIRNFVVRAVAGALLLVALSMIAGCGRAAGRTNVVVDGVFDAGAHALGERPIPLDGDWRVHWPEAPSADGLMRVPSRIHESVPPEVWDSGEGIVDFEVELHGLPLDEPLALYIGRLFPTTTTCTGDDGTTTLSGRNGLDAKHPSSQLAPYVITLPRAKLVRCTVHLFVAHHRRGGRPGLWVTPRLGPARAVFRAFDEERIRDAAFTAMLLTLSGFFFFQWLLRRDERLALHVALFNATAAAWHIGFTHLLDAEPVLGPITRSRIEYAAIPLAAYFGLGTALRIRNAATGPLERFVVSLAAVAAVALLAAPASELHRVLHIVQPFVLLIALAVLGLAVRALFVRDVLPETRLAAIGLLFPAICAAIDVVTSILTLGIGSTLGAGMFMLAVCLALVLARRNARARRAAERYGEATSRFVPREFLQALGDDDVTDAKLGQATEREMTILFADIRNFTTISEALSPEETFRLLNACFASVGPPIREYGGFVDKYIGDAIMALFQGSSSDAVRAAVAMHEALREANDNHAFPVPLELGIGVHVGRVMMGTLGEAERFEATVIADAVNTTARIEGLTKMLGARLVVSDDVAHQLVAEDRTFSRPLGRFALKGKRRSLDLVEVFTADPPDLRESKRRHRARFVAGVEAMLEGRFEDATACFDEVAAAVPDDGAAQWWRLQAASELAAPESTVRSGAIYLGAK
jgi:adenylate cyclase